MEYEIKPFTKADVTAVAELEKECFSSPRNEKMLLEEISLDYSRFLCAKNNDGLLGYIGVEEICKEAYITDVAVFEKFRGNGVGKTLVISAVNGAKERMCEFITLEVRESNKVAISLYENCGFELVGKRKDFYSKPREDGLIYTLNFSRTEGKI